MSSMIITLLVIAGAVVLGILLAYVPLRLIVGTIAKNVVAFIERRRERRGSARDTPDRRKEVPTPPLP